jgi:hypothetical protein
MNYLKLKDDNNFLCLCCLAVGGYLIYLVLYNRPIIEGVSCGGSKSLIESMANRKNCETFNKCRENGNPFTCMQENDLTSKDLEKCRNEDYEDEDEDEDKDDKSFLKIKKKSRKSKNKGVFPRFYDKKQSPKKSRSKNYAKSHLKMIDRTIDRLDDTFDDLMAEYPKCLE